MDQPGSSQRRVIRVAPSADAAQAATPATKAKLYQRAKRPAAMRLEERDLAVVEAVARHRFLSGEQLRRLLFDCGGSMVRRRLRLLYDHGLLDRVAVVAQPTRGIPPFVYVVGKNGAAVLAETAGAPPPSGWRGDSLRLLRHRFLVNELFVTLVEATRGTTLAVGEWRHEEQLKLPTPDGLGRPEQVSHRLLRKAMPFLPDGYFQLNLGKEGSMAFFVEMDLATHPLRVWRERAKLYAAYADPTTGLFRRRFGRENFRLLIITPGDYRGRSRRDNVLGAIRQGIGGPSDLFLAATLNDLRPDRLLGLVWKQVG